jgi:BON domain
MIRSTVSSALGVALLPARLALRLARHATGGGEQPEAPASAPPSPPPAPPRRPPARPKPPPKDLDDVAIARKVESVIFRDRQVAKGKVNVNVADGVVWLRGEVKTPALVNRLGQQASDVPEVTRVENLLHLPKTPAPTRTDTPAPQRKTRRSKPSPGERRVTPANVSEEAPAPTVAEPSPKEMAAAGEGRRPAPLGSHEPEETAGE